MNINSTYKGIRLIIGLVCLCFFNSKAQYITNGNFEDTPRVGVTPTGWIRCLASPDTQPGFFCVTIPAWSGNSYLGEINVGYGNGETSGQILIKPLNYDSIYFFTAFTTQYINTCNGPPSTSGFTHLNLYFGNTTCDFNFLAYQSPEILNFNMWKEYCAIFKPNQNYTNVMISPYGTVPGYRYLIIDNLDLAKAEDRLSYSLTGSNTSVCAGDRKSVV